MKILSIECSAGPVSCALLEDGKIKGSYFLNRNMTHSETLMPMIDDLLKSTGTELDSVDCFAVSEGPGSFTGIRIGIAAIKGLAFKKDTSCVGVSSLLAMAYNHLGQNAVVCAVMDARCNQVYNALFSVEDEKVTRLTEDRAISIKDLLTELNSGGYGDNILLVGDGAALVYKFACQNEQNKIRISPENSRWQNAIGVALAAEIMYNNNRVKSPSELLPVYLRLPQAERELKAKQTEEKI